MDRIIFEFDGTACKIETVPCEDEPGFYYRITITEGVNVVTLNMFSADALNYHAPIYAGCWRRDGMDAWTVDRLVYVCHLAARRIARGEVKAA